MTLLHLELDRNRRERMQRRKQGLTPIGENIMPMLRRRKSRAGRSALDEFRRRRRATMRRAWRDWAMLVGLIVVFAVGVIFFDGWIKVAWAVVLGMLLATLIVFWLIGGDIASLTWVRGAVGERQTEEVLRELPNGWRVFHDVPDGRSNWDHIVIGPAGVFAIDTKSYSSPAVVENDLLRSGRIRTPGSAFRGSAVRLKETLQGHVGVAIWVQAVVVIWGDFRQEIVEENRVVYLEATRLREWLEASAVRLDGALQQRLAAAVETAHRTS